jgi:hypothetical protein
VLDTRLSFTAASKCTETVYGFTKGGEGAGTLLVKYLTTDVSHNCEEENWNIKRNGL